MTSKGFTQSRRRKCLPRLRRSHLLLSALAVLALASCGSPPPSSTSSAPASKAVSVDRGPAAPSEAASATAAPIPRPQLIKTVNLSLQVKSVDASMQSVNQIVQQQQGDVLDLQDFRSEGGAAQSVSMRLRVPQDRLDAMVNALVQLGTIKSRSLKAEDVSNQLVDLQARLKNLRQTEAQLLEIMKQSGSVGDVLKVAQELSQVREQIERVDAQVSGLKQQVAYSTVQVSLSSLVATVPPQRDLGSQLQTTWNNATHSMTELSISLLKLSLWLLVYSPYWAIPLAIVLLARRRVRRLATPAVVQSPDSKD